MGNLQGYLIRVVLGPIAFGRRHIDENAIVF
jgi:hypothetical protein